MDGSPLIFVAYGIVVLGCLTAAMADARWMEIPDRASLALTGAFCLLVPHQDWPEIGAALVAATLACFVLATLFCFGQCGGGDVKVGSTVALFVPSDKWFEFLVLTAVCGLATIGVQLVGRCLLARRGAKAGQGWVMFAPGVGVPFAVPLALAGIAAIALAAAEPSDAFRLPGLS